MVATSCLVEAMAPRRVPQIWGPTAAGCKSDSPANCCTFGEPDGPVAPTCAPPWCCWRRREPADRWGGFVADVTIDSLAGRCSAGDRAALGSCWQAALVGVRVAAAGLGLSRDRRRRERGGSVSAKRAVGWWRWRPAVQNVRSSPAVASGSRSTAVSSPPRSCRRCACIWSR